jgi:hypothetical protein
MILSGNCTRVKDSRKGQLLRKGCVKMRARQGFKQSDHQMQRQIGMKSLGLWERGSNLKN